MNATIHGSDMIISGKTLKEIQRKMQAMLRVSGPRGLTATADTGAVIHTELYQGQDYIKTANGRLITDNPDLIVNDDE